MKKCPICKSQVKKPFKAYCSEECVKKNNRIKLIELTAFKLEKELLDIIKYNLIIRETIGMDFIREQRKEIIRKIKQGKAKLRKSDILE